jgi:hypothetical protein
MSSYKRIITSIFKYDIIELIIVFLATLQITKNIYHILLLGYSLFLIHVYKLHDPLYLIKLYHPDAKIYLTGKYLTDKFINKLNIKDADIYVKNVNGNELYELLKLYTITYVFKNKETNEIERITIYNNNHYIEFSTIPLFGLSKINNLLLNINYITDIYKPLTVSNLENFNKIENITKTWIPQNNNNIFNSSIDILRILRDASQCDLKIDEEYYLKMMEYSNNTVIKNNNNIIMFDELFKFFNTNNSHKFIHDMHTYYIFNMINKEFLEYPIFITNDLQIELSNNKQSCFNFMIFLIHVAKNNNISLREWIKHNNFHPSKNICKKYLEICCFISDFNEDYLNISNKYDLLVFMNKINKHKLYIITMIKLMDVLYNNKFVNIEMVKDNFLNYPMDINEINMYDNYTLHSIYNISFKNINKYKSDLLLKIYKDEIKDDYNLLLTDFEKTFNLI